MKYLCMILLLGLAAPQLSAAQDRGGNRAATAQRQLKHCMSKRMAAEKTLSYYEAMKTCRDQQERVAEVIAAPAAGRRTD